MRPVNAEVMSTASQTRLARIVTAGVVALALLQGGTAAAQEATIDFTVSGSSTIRGWTCTVPGTAQVTAGSSTAVRGLADGVQAATLSLRVKDFVCPQEEMREHLLEALRADEFDEIIFRLESYDVSGPQAHATGSLTILDATAPVTFPISLNTSGTGVEIEGELGLDMTTYGVEPPVVMLGLLRVRPQIRIEFTGLITP